MAIWRIHCTVSPFMVSAKTEGRMLKPVLNISGNTTTVAAGAAAILASNMAKLVVGSSQCKGVCMVVTESVPIR